MGEIAGHPGCYCTSKTRKSESNSQQKTVTSSLSSVVIALVKLENLKAIHNRKKVSFWPLVVVIALVKLENLIAIHNLEPQVKAMFSVVIALVKLENLKAIHNRSRRSASPERLLLH